MGTSATPANLARVTKKPEGSLAQVQRVRQHFEYDLGKLAATIDDSAAEESDIEEGPTDENSVYKNLANGVTEGDKALSRMETKLDSLTTKFDQVARLQPLILRSETKIYEVLGACKKQAPPRL